MRTITFAAVLLALAGPAAAASSLGFSFDQAPGSVFGPGQIGRTDAISIFDGPRVPVRTDNTDLTGSAASAVADRLHQQMIQPVDPQTGLLCPPAAPVRDPMRCPQR
jgi:hypothetical protein